MPSSAETELPRALNPHADDAVATMTLLRATRFFPTASRLALRSPSLRAVAPRRSLCAAKEPPKPDDAAASSAEGPTSITTSGTTETGALREMDDENLPPLEWEPGVAGAAQKGVSAVVIAFGAAAFGACAYGAYLALFPSAGSTQMIAADAMDAVSMDPSVADALGTPLRSYGIDHGTSRGRRNAMERWDREEIGADGDPAEYTTIRFHVAGPLGAAYVHAQVPAKRRRGELRYVIVEDIRTRRLTYVVDNRMQEMEEANAKAAAAAAAAEAAAAKELPSTRAVE